MNNAAPDVSEHRRVPHVVWIVIVIAVTLCVPLVLDGAGALAAISDLSVTGGTGIVALMVCNGLAKTCKLRLLALRVATPAPFGAMLAVSLAADLGFMTTPAGVGGYVASVQGLRRVGASATAATAITAADQCLDALFFLIAVPLAGLFAGSALLRTSPHTVHGDARWLLWLACVLAVIATLVGWIYTRHSRGSIVLRRGQRALWHLASRTRLDLVALQSGGVRLFVSLAALTLLQQASRYGVLALVFSSLGDTVPLPVVFVLQTLVVQAASWTGLPAGVGAAEIGLTASFSAWIPAAHLAAALLIWRAATLYLGLIAGVIAVLWLGRKRSAPAQLVPLS